VVTLKLGETERHYRLPTERDYDAVRQAQERVAKMLTEWERGGKQGLCPVPDEPTPGGGGSGAGRAFSVQRYGILQWGDLFTARQKAALMTLGEAIRKHGDPNESEIFGMLLSGVVDRNAVLTRWRPQADQEKVENVFARPALPMSWDFAEAVALSESTGSWDDRVDMTSRTVEVFSPWAQRLSGNMAWQKSGFVG
jgi:putative DNA methylase